MSQVRANSITDAAGTGAPDFPNGIEVSGGDVGIGTIPAAKFHVNSGLANLAGLFESADAGATITLIDNSTTGGSVAEHGLNTVGNELEVRAVSALAFETAATERARIDSSGNLMVGTTTAQSSSANRGNITVGGSAGSIVNWASASSRLGYIFHDGSNMQINNNTGGYLNFYTSDIERARIDSSGNLLVGTTSVINGHTFKSGEGATTYRPTSTATFGIHHFYSDFGSTQSLRAYFNANGGLSNFSANNVNLSDERVKTDILPVGSYWDKVKALQVVTYKYRDQSDGEDNIGVIAQQVESVAPEFVCTSGFGETPEDGVPLKSIYETDMHYATLKALQEAMARIEELTARVAELEA